MNGWAIAASWIGAALSGLGAVVAWLGARAAKQTAAIEQQRHHEERAPQLHGEFHADPDGARVELHHDDGTVPDRVHVRVTEAPPRFGDGFAGPHEPERATITMSAGGRAILWLLANTRQDARIGGLLVLDCLAEAEDEEWSVPVRVDIPTEPPKPFVACS